MNGRSVSGGATAAVGTIRSWIAATACMVAVGCGTIYNDQVAVPGTNQRLVAGTAGGGLFPYAQVWVIEGDHVEVVNVVDGVQR